MTFRSCGVVVLIGFLLLLVAALLFACGLLLGLRSVNLTILFNFTFFFKLAALSPRIKRVYFFHWEQPSIPNYTWDSGLLDANGRCGDGLMRAALGRQ